MRPRKALPTGVSSFWAMRSRCCGGREELRPWIAAVLRRGRNINRAATVGSPSHLKGAFGHEIASTVARKLEGNGVVVRSVGVKDVILPGEMKVILNQVVEAEKVAQANLIRRREETAATRSLLNTARLMDDNPTLLRLKELETLEKVTEKIDKLTVFGGLEGVLKDVVRIQVPGA